jgi:hypothetical protein
MTMRLALRFRRMFDVLGVICACTGPALTFGAQDRAGVPGSEQAQREADLKEQRKKELDNMRRRAESTSVFQIHGANKIPMKIAAEPVFRYDDQVRRHFDGTLWIYGSNGRPAAVQKVTCYRGRPGFPKYEFCFASLSDDLLEVHWAGDPDWSSTKPGVGMRELPGGPKPAATDAGRMLQMKELVRRFSATIADYPDKREEFRLLTRPLHRYRDLGSGIQDGAIFPLVCSGTNPDLLMLIELRGSDSARATWQYSPVRMTASEVKVRLDGKEVWSVPAQCMPGRNAYDTWIFFFPRQDNPSSMEEAAFRRTTPGLTLDSAVAVASLLRREWR